MEVVAFRLTLTWIFHVTVNSRTRFRESGSAQVLFVHVFPSFVPLLLVLLYLADSF